MIRKSFAIYSLVLVCQLLNFQSSETFAADNPASPLKGFGEINSSEPTFISSKSLTLFNAERRFTYDGDVVVEQGDMTIKGETLSGTYSEKNEIIEITVRNNVEIIKKDQLRAAGGRAVYNRAQDTIILTDSPSVEQNGSLLSADKITVYVKENRSVAEGEVKVKLIKKDEPSPDPIKR